MNSRILPLLRGVIVIGALAASACSPIYDRTLQSTPSTREDLFAARVVEARDAQRAALSAMSALRLPSKGFQDGDEGQKLLAVCEESVWDARKSLASVQDVAPPAAQAASAQLDDILNAARQAAASLEALDMALQRHISTPGSAPPLDAPLDLASADLRRFITAAEEFLARPRVSEARPSSPPGH